MQTPKIWIEITVSGFAFLAAGFFLILAILRVDDLSFFNSIKDFTPFFSLALILLSYIVGLSLHTMSQAWYWDRKERKMGKDERHKGERHKGEILVFRQDVPQRALDLVKTFYSTFVMFRLLAFGSFALVVSLLIWSARTRWTAHKAIATLSCVLAGLAFCKSYLNYRKQLAFIEQEVGRRWPEPQQPNSPTSGDS